MHGHQQCLEYIYLQLTPCLITHPYDGVLKTSSVPSLLHFSLQTIVQVQYEMCMGESS